MYSTNTHKLLQGGLERLRGRVPVFVVTRASGSNTSGSGLTGTSLGRLKTRNAMFLISAFFPQPAGGRLQAVGLDRSWGVSMKLLSLVRVKVEGAFCTHTILLKGLVG